MWRQCSWHEHDTEKVVTFQLSDPPRSDADDDHDEDGAASLGAASSPAAPPVLITTVDIGEGRSDRIELRVGDSPMVRTACLRMRRFMPRLRGCKSPPDSGRRAQVR